MTRRRTSLLAFIVIAMVLLGACAGSGDPDEYGDVTRDNFVEACEAVGAEELADAVSAVCQCSYQRIVVEIPFEDFTNLDDDLRSDINAEFPPEVSDLIAGCIRSEAAS